MKKTFFAAIFLCFFNIAQGEEEYLSSVDLANYNFDQRISFFYDLQGNRTVQIKERRSGGIFEKFEYAQWFYNENVCLSEVRQIWQNNEFVNKQRIDYDYLTDKITNKTVKKWENATWVNFSQESNNYVGENLKTSIQRTWENGAWLNQIKTEYEYINNNTISKMTFLLWSNNQWVNNRKAEISLNEETFYLWNGMAWVADEKTTYLYNSLNLKELEEKQTWDNNNQKWQKKIRFEYQYNVAGKIISQENTVWDNSRWQNDLKIIYSYDNQQNIVEKNYFSWINNMWRIAYFDVFSYANENQTAIEAKKTFWGAASDEYQKHIPLFIKNNEYAKVFFGYRAEATYKPLSEVIQDPGIEVKIPLTSTDFVVYPNPSVDGKFYFYMSPDFQIKTCAVFSINGKMVKNFDNNNSNVLDLSDCKSGVYILKLESDKVKMKKKLVLIKH